MFRREFIKLLYLFCFGQLPLIDTQNIKEEEIDRLVRIAVDRNLLVYDVDAMSGNFTKRLYNLIYNCGIRNSTTLVPASKIKKIYFEPNQLTRLGCKKDFLKGENIEVCYHYYMRPSFDKLKGDLAKDDKYLIIVQFDNGEVLAGSY